MATFSTTVLSALCLSVMATLTLGQTGDPNAMNPLYLLTHPDALTPEAQCPTLCATSCAASQLTCTNVPDLIDCDNTNTLCTAQCSQLCGCLSNCADKCAENYPCSDDPSQSLMQIGCLSQRLICKGACQMNCPATMVIQGLASAVQMVIVQVNTLMGPMTAPAARR